MREITAAFLDLQCIHKMLKNYELPNDLKTLSYSQLQSLLKDSGKQFSFCVSLVISDQEEQKYIENLYSIFTNVSQSTPEKIPDFVLEIDQAIAKFQDCIVKSVKSLKSDDEINLCTAIGIKRKKDLLDHGTNMMEVIELLKT